ncbi:MAG: T9SS type A sorting domain-containing protein [Bacteroidota bacterium]|nr:T9SS type A sorting domain-containing protein [Bacteroidota bacterium]
MKNFLNMPRRAVLPRLFGCLLLLVLLALLAHSARAQFPGTASQTQFMCNAPGVQFGVQAFADGAGGAYSVWIDKRGGNNSGPGTALYAQHLDANGTTLLPANGLRLLQTRGRDIFALRAVPWQNGMLVAWIQGGFSIGGDSLRCQYFSAAGVPQWAAPTVVATRDAMVIGVAGTGFDIIPTSTGATLTYSQGIIYTGGTNFSYNRISYTGQRLLANNQMSFALPNSNYFNTVADGSDGFYVVSGSGGLGSRLFAQHYDASGAAWANALDLTATGANGRGGQTWRAVRDPAGNLYAVWGSNSGDIIAAQVTPGGVLGWSAPGYRTLCSNPSYQSVPDALWHNNALWAVWSDDRTGQNSQTTYIQKADAAGTLAWPAAGVLVNSLPAFSPEPRLAPSDNGAVLAIYITNYSAGTGLRVQRIRPDASLAFPVNGVALHTVDPDRAFDQDLVPVAQPNGSVQVFWASLGGTSTDRNICASRMQNSGTLLGPTERAAAAVGFDVFPSPAAGELWVSLPAEHAAGPLALFDVTGRLVRHFSAAEAAQALSLRGLPPGLYMLRGQVAGQAVSRRVVVE